MCIYIKLRSSYINMAKYVFTKGSAEKPRTRGQHKKEEKITFILFKCVY